MNAELPPISYLVTAKYNVNSVGLKSLFRKAYSNDVFLDARNKAFDFYSATIEMLMDNKEISFNLKNQNTYFSKKSFHQIIEKCNNVMVDYKIPNDFNRGIQIYLRINEDIKLKNQTLKKDDLFLIESFNFLSPNEIQEIVKNQKLELEIYHRFKQDKSRIIRQFIFNKNGYFDEHFSLFTHHQFEGSGPHNIFKKEIEKEIKKSSIKEYQSLLKSENPLRIEFCKPKDLMFLAETVSAFLSSDEVCYISMKLPNQKYQFGNNKTMQGISMNFLQRKFVFDGRYIRFYTFSRRGKVYAFYRIDGKNCSGTVGFPVDDENTSYETYERTRFGNVLILD